MRRRMWGASIAVAAISAGVVGYLVSRPDPVPAVTGTVTVLSVDGKSPESERFHADVGRHDAGQVYGTTVEVRVAWATSKPPESDCSAEVLLLPDVFDVRQALQYAVLPPQQSSPAAKQFEFDTFDDGWAATSGAPVTFGSDGRVVPVLRDAGLPATQMLALTAADPRSGTLVHVYDQGSSVPVDPTRFRAWALMQCDDRVGPLTALTMAGS